jgi:glycosyltransferase involved in cell wall biosynthesis
MRGVEHHVCLVGEIENASQYMKGFDLFALPSRYEGLSITLIEAIVAGLPTLASDVGGAAEQFAHATEQVYPLDDGPAFRARVAELIENPQKRDELHQANLSRAPEFDIARVAKQYLAVYRGRPPSEAECSGIHKH